MSEEKRNDEFTKKDAGILATVVVILVTIGFSLHLLYKNSEVPSYGYTRSIWLVKENPDIFLPLVKDAMEDGVITRGEFDEISDVEEALDLVEAKAKLQRILANA